MKPEGSNAAAGLGHQAITASAGTGKTYQLAHRYLRLMAAGVPPERIAAMTFSRKAAGEIFDKIVGYLVEYMAQPGLGQERLALPQPMSAEDFTALLRRLLEALPRLRISTLDSFTVSLAGAFPLELGISPDLQLIDNDGAAAGEAVRETLDALFAAQALDAQARSEFVELFKQATFGLEEKNIELALQNLLDRAREAWLAAPDLDRWGTPARIWPELPDWLTQPPDGARVVRAADEFLESLRKLELGHKSAKGKWAELVETAAGFTPQSPPDTADPFLKVIGPLAAQLTSGQAVAKVYKDLALTRDQGRALRVLLDHVLAIAIQRALVSTQGAGRFLKLFEAYYDELVRRRGRLTFGDLQMLLAPGKVFNGGITISRRCDAERLYIDYRLDGRLDHWLLDEFQDTSDQQWRVLDNLADEILQDDSGTRTFFLVGDVKQSIYGWRAGNPELFDRLLARYPHMARTQLAASRRSCPSVIAAVNRTFGGFDGVPDLPEATARRWAKIWQEHSCADVVGKLPGYAALLDLPPIGDEKPGAEDRYRALAALLQDIDPLRHGWSAAVLVRTNAQVKAICQHLRLQAPGLRVANEGVAAILDNPAVNSLLALARWAAHPGDTFAAQQVNMSPLARPPHAPRSPAALLREIQEQGFQRFFRHWRAELEARQPLNAYEHRRLDELLIAAGLFDATREREVNAFLRYMEDYQTHEPQAEDAVRVMTIHQAKGLEFDLVVLPELQEPLGSRLPTLLRKTTADTRQTEWVLLAPRRPALDSEPLLAAQMDQERARGMLEEICLLYVAMTRARRGLYLLTSFPGRSSKALTAASLLKQQLGGDADPSEGTEWALGSDRLRCLYETGERDWHRTPGKPRPAAPPKEPASRKPAPRGAAAPVRRRLVRVEPSRGAETNRRAEWLFHQENRATLEFGHAIHELLREVEWTETADPAEILRAFQARSAYAEDVQRDASAQFRRALADPEVRQALARPGPDAELWREQAFEAVLDDAWISGAFDRVVIRRDAAGQPQSAVILDFKSNRVNTLPEMQAKAEEYRFQLHWYRRALAALLSLPEDCIRVQILFTRPGRLVELC